MAPRRPLRLSRELLQNGTQEQNTLDITLQTKLKVICQFHMHKSTVCSKMINGRICMTTNVLQFLNLYLYFLVDIN